MILWNKVWTAFIETICMSGLSFIGALVIGIPLGVLLFSSSPRGIRPRRLLNKILGVTINVLRSVPFLIMFAILYPAMSVTMGKYSIGWTAMVPPLVLSAAPFIARLVESSLSDVPAGEAEAIRSLGATSYQLLSRVYLVEARSSLTMNAVIAFVTIVSYTAMSGIVAGGGLGDLALNYAFRHVTTDLGLQTRMVWVASVTLVLLVNIMQEIGLFMARKIDHRK